MALKELLFVVVLSVTSITRTYQLSCIECTKEYKESCSVDPATCVYGVGVSGCGCCDECNKGPGEQCGGMWNFGGSCGEGFECLFPNGTVMETGTGTYYDEFGTCFSKCPPTCEPETCPEVMCGVFGTALDFCGCCPVCSKEPRDVCGNTRNKDGSCPVGYECTSCDGEILNTNPGSSNDKSGTCERVCECCEDPLTCTAEFKPCLHGDDLDRCTCSCDRPCLKGLGEPCGSQVGSCLRGSKCVNADGFGIDTFQTLNGNESGICSQGCLPSTPCEEAFCLLLVCEFGYGPDPCSCCPECLMGPGEKCGSRIGSCLKGYECVSPNKKIIDTRPATTNDQTGTCQVVCCNIICEEDDSSSEEFCDYGIDPYSCCPRCLKGPDECCGSEYGFCNEDLQLDCVSKDGTIIIRGSVFTEGLTGTCLARCPDSCAAISCFVPENCDHGYETDRCGCCPVCKKAPECPCEDCKPCKDDD